MVDDAPTSTPAAGPARRHRRHQAADEVRAGRRSVAAWGLSIVLCVLFVSSLIGENGYLATWRARREERALTASLALLRLENQRLQQEAARLRADPTALEETARRELGLIRPGETLVIVRDTRPAAPLPR